MNKNNIITGILIILSIFIAFYQYKKYNIAPKITFPNLSLTDLDNNPVDWKQIQKPVFINFFGTWCIDCKKEMPELAILYGAFQREGIEMILISDEPVEILKNYKNNTALPMKIYHINTSLQEIGIHTFPTSYLINKEQEVVYKATNVQDWTGEKLKKELIEAVKP